MDFRTYLGIEESRPSNRTRQNVYRNAYLVYLLNEFGTKWKTRDKSGPFHMVTWCIIFDCVQAGEQRRKMKTNRIEWKTLRS